MEIPHLLTQSFKGDFQIRQGEWKFLDHMLSGGEPGNNYSRGFMAQYLLPETAPNATGQLFHLGDDPGETTNLFFKESQKRQELQTLLSNLKSSGRSAPKGRKPIGIENIPLVTPKNKNRKGKREIIPVVDVSSAKALVF